MLYISAHNAITSNRAFQFSVKESLLSRYDGMANLLLLIIWQSIIVIYFQ